MKIDVDTIGFTEGKKLVIAEKLMSGGIVIAAVGLITTFAGRLISTKTSTWLINKDPVGKKQIADICNVLHDSVKK